MAFCILDIKICLHTIFLIQNQTKRILQLILAATLSKNDLNYAQNHYLNKWAFWILQIKIILYSVVHELKKITSFRPVWGWFWGKIVVNYFKMRPKTILFLK